MTRKKGPGRSVKLRIKLCSFSALGPGKIELLEGIGETGSISKAAKRSGMSYRRAWMLVDEMNRAFALPVADTQFGGARGGGARLTPTGQRIVDVYREILAKTEALVAVELTALGDLLAPDLEDRSGEAERVHGKARWRSDWREENG
ncbi:MAG: LysR family transcriptional regulator [Magnetospirillum sp. WYHS-4]